MSDFDLPYKRESVVNYESGQAELTKQFVLFTVDAGYDAENNPGIERFLKSVNALKTGTSTWLAQTKMTPDQIVQSIRRHLDVNEAVYAFTVCNQFAWAGPRYVREFFQLYGARMQHSEEIPPPAHPESEP